MKAPLLLPGKDVPDDGLRVILRVRQGAKRHQVSERKGDTFYNLPLTPILSGGSHLYLDTARTGPTLQWRQPTCGVRLVQAQVKLPEQAVRTHAAGTCPRHPRQCSPIRRPHLNPEQNHLCGTKHSVTLGTRALQGSP